MNDSRTMADNSIDAKGGEGAYTYHYEERAVGGARYVRCADCGREAVPADPERILHRVGCSEGSR